MPPFPALRTLMALAVTESCRDLNGNWTRKTDRQFLSFDVKRLHFCPNATRKLYVELPPGAGHGPDIVGHLLKSMYGCRDAGMNWELEVCRVMKKARSRPGIIITLYVLPSYVRNPKCCPWRRFHESRNEGTSRMVPQKFAEGVDHHNQRTC